MMNLKLNEMFKDALKLRKLVICYTEQLEAILHPLNRLTNFVQI